MNDADLYKKALKKARRKKGAMISFIIWAMFIPFFIFIDISDGGGLDWAFYPIFGWGIGVFIALIKAFDFFGYGEKWEEEEVRKEMMKRKDLLNQFEDAYGDLDQLDLEDLKEIRRVSKDSDFV